MSMVINHNIAALNTYRQLSINTADQQKSLAKLSSGYRINSAADDAAGLAISEKMRGQISGLDQASRNAQDGISLVQTAEGALNETTSILQRMRELAVQSSSDTNTDQDRTNLQSEMTQMTNEIDRIRNTTQFNTKNLLDGSMSGKQANAVKSVDTSAILKDTGSLVTNTSSLLVSLQDSNGNSLGMASGDTITLSYFENGAYQTSNMTITGSTKLSDITGTLTSGFTLGTTSSGALTATATTAGLDTAINGLTITVDDSSGNQRATATAALSSFTESTAAANATAQDGRATFQIGANTNQNMQLSITDMGAKSLGVNSLDISTQDHANVAIKVIDTATQKVSAMRSNLGAVQNRLDHTINNLGTANENLTAAESRIRDVDMASEMMNYSKDNILTQAATAMLAQANQQPQGVLQLLR